MHELSIAESVLATARRHLPAAARLRMVRLRVGPFRGIDPGSMELAWQACTRGSDAEGSRIQLDQLPWKLRCRQCARVFEGEWLNAICQCGCADVFPVGGDELQVVSLEIDDRPAGKQLM